MVRSSAFLVHHWSKYTAKKANLAVHARMPSLKIEISVLRGAARQKPLPTCTASKVVPVTGMDQTVYDSLMNEIRVHVRVPLPPIIPEMLLSFRESALHFFAMPLFTGGTHYDTWE